MCHYQEICLEVLQPIEFSVLSRTENETNLIIFAINKF
jgi:hypothetical protein